MKELLAISSQFALNGAPIEVKPLGEGFINDTYIISTNADSYLLQRNWIQIALLGDPARASTEKLLRVLRIVCGRREPRRLQPAQAASHSA